MAAKINGDDVSDDKLKILFGFVLLMALIGLIVIIALGSVEEKTSHGLMPLITTLSTIGGAFANWAFGKGKDS